MEQISCVMITENRFEQFKRSVACYCDQEYSAKELVVVSCGCDEYQSQIRRHVDSIGRSDIRSVCPRSRMSLGALRNLSLQEACGPLICQWDDCDVSHPSRIGFQLDTMVRANAEASFLFDNFHLFTDTGQLYWCDWSRSQAHIGHPASLVAYKAVIPEYDEMFMQQEDYTLQQQMCQRGIHMAVPSGYGFLYMTIYDGNNPSKRDREAALVKAYGMEEATLRNRTSLIRSALNGYRLEMELSIVDHMGKSVLAWPATEHETDIDLESNIGGARVFIYAA